MILRRANGQNIGAIGEDEETGFLALHEFLDHHFGTGCAKFAAEHIVDGGQGFGLGHGDDHAFASGQTIGFNHNRRALLADIGARGVGIGEMGVSRGWGTAGIADILGECLGGFQLCGCRRWPEGKHPCRAQPVGNACGQGGLGADDDECDRVGLGKGDNRITIQNIQIGAFRDLGDPRISGGHDQLVALGVLQSRPCQRMFAPAAAQYQDIHRMPPLGLRRWAF